MTLPRHTLRSTAYDLADALDVNELYQQKGWTDGLPIVPPTEERIRECLQTAGLAAADLVGVEPIRQRPITAEKVTINTVMAGCLPTYRPVVGGHSAGHVPGAVQPARQHGQYRGLCAIHSNVMIIGD